MEPRTYAPRGRRSRYPPRLKGVPRFIGLQLIPHRRPWRVWEAPPPLGSWREYEVLSRRAGALWRHASEALERGEYDLACFLAERLCSLKLKPC